MNTFAMVFGYITLIALICVIIGILLGIMIDTIKVKIRERTCPQIGEMVICKSCQTLVKLEKYNGYYDLEINCCYHNTFRRGAWPRVIKKLSDEQKAGLL